MEAISGAVIAKQVATHPRDDGLSKFLRIGEERVFKDTQRSMEYRIELQNFVDASPDRPGKHAITHLVSLDSITAALNSDRALNILFKPGFPTTLVNATLNFSFQVQVSPLRRLPVKREDENVRSNSNN